MLKRNLVDGITVIFIILFLYTGINKIMDYSVFKEQIATSQLLAPVASFIAILLPIAEFIVVILLAIPRWRLKGLFASSFLMTLFTFYIAVILLFNKEVPCSCGGALETLSWIEHIVFNITLIGLGISGVLMEKKFKNENKEELNLIVN